MNPGLTVDVAVALRNRSLRLHCLACRLSATSAEILGSLPDVERARVLHVYALAPCHGCGSRKGVTYSSTSFDSAPPSPGVRL
jgi:hypothetical protein